MKTAQADYYDHPVFVAEELHIQTQAMKRMSEVVHQWLWNSTTGGLILGTPRSGKTRSVRSLQHGLYTRGKVFVPSYYIGIPPRDKSTITSVFRQLCLGEGLRVTRRDVADDLSDRYISYLYDKSTEHNCRDAVLFVDEMQRLVPRQFNAFAEVYDKLTPMGVNLMVVFIGNDQESSDMIKVIQSRKFAHIHGRFFTQGYTFRGLTSKDEIYQCLNQYDKLRYPRKGPTYTAFFLPKAVKKGWKLASISSDLWRVFRVYQKNYDIDSWGMKFFTITVNTLLADFLPAYGVEAFNDKMVHESIRISGLIPSLVKPVR